MIYRYGDISQNQNLSCDVCVVGSGAGGAALAKELAEAGLSVIVLEEGSHVRTEDFRVDDTIGSTARLYRDAGGTIIYGKPNIMLAEGRCVGGSTVMNGGMCWRTPEKILKRWQWEMGLSDMTPERMDRYFSRVEGIISARPMVPEARNRDSELLRDGAKKLGYRYNANVRSQNICVGSNMCMSGCPTGAKQSTLSSYIPLMTRAGGVVYSDCLVQKVVVKGGRAAGVDAVLIDPVTRRKGFKIKVRSKVTVVCGGAVQSPALLKRSHVRDDGHQLGRNLLVHPNVKVLAVFDEDVRGWNGVIQGFQITEFFDEGILMAVNFTPPGIVAIALPLMGDEIMNILKDEYHHMVLGGALIEDTGTGRVVCGPMGTAIPIYNINDHDFHQAIRGTALLAEVFFSAGAKKCYLPFAHFSEIRSIDDIPRIYEQKIRPLDMEMLTVHVMGTCRMGVDPKRSVVGPFGEFHNIRGLYVADASVFPSSIGVNPQVTIMALATRTAEHIAENFSRYNNL